MKTYNNVSTITKVLALLKFQGFFEFVATLKLKTLFLKQLKPDRKYPFHDISVIELSLVIETVFIRT